MATVDYTQELGRGAFGVVYRVSVHSVSCAHMFCERLNVCPHLLDNQIGIPSGTDIFGQRKTIFTRTKHIRTLRMKIWTKSQFVRIEIGRTVLDRMDVQFRCISFLAFPPRFTNSIRSFRLAYFIFKPFRQNEDAIQLPISYL